MPLGRTLLLAAAKSDRLNRFATRSRVVRRATKAFMPGERPEDALDAGERIAKDGRGLIYTKLGEALTALLGDPGRREVVARDGLAVVRARRGAVLRTVRELAARDLWPVA